MKTGIVLVAACLLSAGAMAFELDTGRPLPQPPVILGPDLHDYLRREHDKIEELERRLERQELRLNDLRAAEPHAYGGNPGENLRALCEVERRATGRLPKDCPR